MSQNNLHSGGIFPTKSDSSTVAQQQPNCSTKSPATLTNGPREYDCKENTYKLFSGKNALEIIKEVFNRDDGHNFSYFTPTPEECFGLAAKPKSTDGAAPLKGK
ncbi:hypothetical protein NL676_014261 [Syzygium grande]|nr:hypothetical protein NL676_014261 [Syzygium grande]